MPDIKTISLSDITSAEHERIKTGIIMLDNFLNGGFVLGQCILLGADPGAGKSTSTMQIGSQFCKLGYKVLYFSGEESLGQIKLRANRLSANSTNFVCTEDLELNDMYKIIEQIDPMLIIIDSMPMIYSNKIDAPIGSDKQMREVVLSFTKYIKKTNKITIIIGHANKNGALAGLLKFQHMVDSTFYIKVIEHIRTLRIIKNRFGPDSNELTLHMQENGFLELTNDYQENKQTNNSTMELPKQYKHLKIKQYNKGFYIFIFTVLIIEVFVFLFH